VSNRAYIATLLPFLSPNSQFSFQCIRRGTRVRLNTHNPRCGKETWDVFAERPQPAILYGIPFLRAITDGRRPPEMRSAALVGKQEPFRWRFISPAPTSLLNCQSSRVQPGRHGPGSALKNQGTRLVPIVSCRVYRHPQFTKQRTSPFGDSSALGQWEAWMLDGNFATRRVLSAP